MSKLALAAVLLLAPAHCGAARWPWNVVPDRWADPAPAAQATEKGWYADEVFGDAGLNFRAMNDGSRLYLLIMADGREGRAVLSGAFRQDVTVWFSGPGGKKRAWGVRVPFSRLGALDLTAIDDIVSLGGAPALASVEPELVTPQGADISSAPLTADVALRTGVSGKDPIYSLVVPLERLAGAADKKVLLDFTTSKMDPELELQLHALSARRPRGNASPDDPSRRRRGEVDLMEGPRSDRVGAPPALDLQLFLRLAKASK